MRAAVDSKSSKPASEVVLLREPVASRPGAQPKQVHIDLDHLQRAGLATPGGGRDRINEEYRLIKRPILALAGTASRNSNLVMVTSAGPGEGKTFTAISLAMSVVAEGNIPVLLVDLDLGRQDMCQTLGIARDVGLLDVLGHPAPPLAELFVHTDVPRLAVVPGGADQPLAHELLASPKMRDLLGYLSNLYCEGLVIIDTAPVLVSADTTVLAPHMGQVVLVVEANRTSRTSVEEAISLLHGPEKISLVLNKVMASELVDQYGSYYGGPHNRETFGTLSGFLSRMSASVGKRLLRLVKKP